MSRHAFSAVLKFTLSRIKVTQSDPEQNSRQEPVDFVQNPDLKKSRMQMDDKIFQIFIFNLFAATNAVKMLAVEVLRIDWHSSGELLRAGSSNTPQDKGKLKDRKEKR